MTDISERSTTRRRGAGRDRDHQRPGRPRQVMLRYTEEEFAAIKQAARDAGLTPTGFAAEAALATAMGSDAPSTAPWRSALLELMDARAQVRRIGVNINQASRAINATGEPPIWLEHALAITNRAVTRLDAAAAALSDVAGRSRARTDHPDAPSSDKPLALSANCLL